MFNNPLFSILIANYNNGKYFEECYKSLIAQTYQNFEAIIVDDCSTDKSVEIINNIIKDDSRFKLYQNEENKGCGYTKRKCAELAAGEICGFVDPDDAITENALEIMIQKHSENPDCSLMYSGFLFCDNQLNIRSESFNKQVENNDQNFFNFNGSISHFAAFKNNFYKQTNGIDPYLQRAVDQDLYLKLYEKGKVLYINEHLYLYRIHENGISTNKNIEKAFFWHWVVVIKSAERRNINIENLFVENFIKRKTFTKIVDKEKNKIELLKKSRLLKILYKLGVFKAYKYL